jgi:alcohol dehydrogenase YqhD (iron-dependent ADH family)
VVCSLNQSKIEYVILQGVRANPTFDLVREGIKLVRENNVDYILPIGGGSVIDTAKCIAVSYDYEGDIRDFNARKVTPTHALPIGFILTISAAGSEMSSSCVVQDDETMMKNGFNSDFNRPAFVIENPELTYSVSKEQTAYGIVDIAMHSLERYFYQSEEYELADDIALAVIKNVFDVGLLCFNNPTNYEYRAKIMLDSSLSHNGITHIGKGFSLPVHQLEHALSGKFPNIAHGLGLAILFPAWCRYYYKYDIDKFATLGERVFDIYSGNKVEDAKSTIDAFEEYFASFNLPSRYQKWESKKKILMT